MSARDRFFIYLLEHYAEQGGMSGQAVLAQWDELGITQDVLDLYELYHTEAIENAYEDINERVRQAQTSGS